MTHTCTKCNSELPFSATPDIVICPNCGLVNKVKNTDNLTFTLDPLPTSQITSESCGDSNDTSCDSGSE